MAFKDKAARDAMNRARICLNVSQPFFGCLSMHLQLVEVEDENFCSTMAVDGKNLFYWPPFALSLSEQEIIGVCAHETEHCALRHMTRRGHRDPRIWNIAADFVINADLLKCGLTLPGKPITMADLLAHAKNKKSKEVDKSVGHLYDPQFEGQTTEEVYEKILEKCIKIKINISDPGGCGEVRDAAGGQSSGNETEAANLDAEWESNVRQAVNVATKINAGTVPGQLKRLVDELNKPRIDWRGQLRDFISTSMSKDFSWSKMNRRSAGCGVLLPGLIDDAMHHLICCFDVSGSIGHDLMKTFGSEAAGMLEDGICDKMTIIYVDTEVKREAEFLRGELVKIETPGGGGTDFKSCMEHVFANYSDAAALVFLTDMCTGSYGEDPGIPTLWGSITPKGQYQEPPFGRVIYIPPSGE